MKTKEEINERNRQYYAEHKEHVIEKIKEWKNNNQDKVKEYNKKWIENNKEKILEYQREWRKTPIGRATSLLCAYNQADKNMVRGKGDLTVQWIVDNIFTKSCLYCGESDWTKLGCNRLDNSKPHTIDNVEPCCGKCNQLLQKQRRDKKSGKFIKMESSSPLLSQCRPI